MITNPPMFNLRGLLLVYFGGFICYLVLNQISNPWSDMILFRIAAKFLPYAVVTAITMAIALVIARASKSNRSGHVYRFLIPAVVVVWPIYFFDLVSDLSNTRKYSAIEDSVILGSTDSTELTEFLSKAAREGDVQKVGALISAGVDVNARNDGGYSALSAAAGEGHTSIITLLLQAGADPNSRLKDGTTAIGYAAWMGQEEAVKILAESGADPNSVKDNGYTPLIEAATRGHQKVVEFLLAIGADTNARTAEGMTAEQGASLFGYDEVAKTIRDRQTE